PPPRAAKPTRSSRRPYAAERGVDVGIAGAKPIAEAWTQQLPRRRRRCTLHHKMLAVKKIGRVLGIGRHWREPGERRKGRRGPFPAVSNQIVNPPGALPRRMAPGRLRVPTVEIEDASRRVGRLIAPRVLAEGAVGGGECCALKFCFRWQPGPAPPGIRAGFGM